MKIGFAGLDTDYTGAIAVIFDEKTGLSAAGGALDKVTGGQLTRAIKDAAFKGKAESSLVVVAPNNIKATRIVIAGGGKAGVRSRYALEKLGGAIAGKLMEGRGKAASIIADELAGDGIEPAEAAALIGSGARLRGYSFDKYRSKKKDDDDKVKLASLTIKVSSPEPARKAFQPLEKIAEGVDLARDLVNEPANILFPEEFASRAKALSTLGLKVEVLDEAKMEKLKMGALLGVGRGSSRASRLVVMRWEGGKSGDKPVAFIGKGVTFDTGGISIKPAGGMEDMKGDMGGAACVTGLMAALAGRKAKANVVGLIGLVENMPDGDAQRPGDIVTSMSGQTIEVLNTDAEGRLVLADVLHYANTRFEPRFMVDLATLTGAILVALGTEYAGMFSNNDDLAGRISDAGEETGEKVWRMPLGKVYDKMIDSKTADMKNIGGRHAGSITAAQFLKRFVGDTAWVHLDVAGTAMKSPSTPINRSWGSGYGVRLLDRLIAGHYEK